MSLHRLLLVEDDAEMAAMLAAYLQRQGFHVSRADSRAGALEALRTGRVDLILLDVSLGKDDGVQICAEIRAAQDVPIIMVSALSADHQRMAGYEVGADDYIAKPFAMDALLARIRALLRRSGGVATRGTLTYRDLTMDQDAHRVSRNGRPLHLGPTEYRLLEFFLQHPGRVFTREQLLDAVWGRDIHVEPRTVDVHIRRLRKAINGENEVDVIRTVRSAGYALDAEDH